jgi:DNA-directed RNA polymerase specialized sigma24 family protein
MEGPVDDHHHDDLEFLAGERELSQLVAETNWDEQTPKHVLHATYVLRRHGPNATRYGWTPRDYVQEAIVRMLDGQRRYPAGTGLPLSTFINGIIDSLISHTGDRLEHSKEHVAANGEEGPGQLQQPDRGDSPEETIIARNKLDRFAATLEPQLRRLVEVLATDPRATAKECAKALGTSVADVLNMKKVLKRRKFRWNLS